MAKVIQQSTSPDNDVTLLMQGLQGVNFNQIYLNVTSVKSGGKGNFNFLLKCSHRRLKHGNLNI